MKRILIISFIALAAALTPCAAQKSVSQVKKQKQAAQSEVKQAQSDVNANLAQTKRQLNQLDKLDAEIAEHGKSITALSGQLSTIEARAAVLTDSIKECDARLRKLQADYIKTVKAMQARRGSSDAIAFIFSADSFKQAMRRVRYLRQVTKWRKQQVADIAAARTALQEKKDALAGVLKEKNATLASLNATHASMNAKKNEQAKVVEQLKAEGSALQQVLAEKRRRVAELDAQLDRLIAEQERKAAEERRLAEERRIAEEKRKAEEKAKKEADAKAKREADERAKRDAEAAKKQSNVDGALTGSFESNKGKLMSPVTARYKVVRPFGRQRHAELSHVETDNGGIDIETDSGASARAVYEGVATVFRTDGFNTVVMLRHGNYITVYANLQSASVTTGQTVKAGQVLGRIYSDPDDGNRTILHFEVRREREKLNPQSWIR